MAKLKNLEHVHILPRFDSQANRVELCSFEMDLPKAVHQLSHGKFQRRDTLWKIEVPVVFIN